jgi:hypothetical protein
MMFKPKPSTTANLFEENRAELSIESKLTRMLNDPFFPLTFSELIGITGTISRKLKTV